MERIAALEALELRLKAAGISLASVCRRADMNGTTVSRWKLGTQPRESAWLRFVAAAEALLAEPSAPHPGPLPAGEGASPQPQPSEAA